MTKPIYSNNYRRNLKLYWRQFFPSYMIPSGYHVHHIKPKCTFEDKNDPRIHHPRNLIALHPDDHVSIHKCRGDKISKNFITATVDRKMSSEERNSRTGNGNPMHGKRHTLEAKLKMSIARRGQKGHSPSSATRRLLSESKLGSKNPMFGKMVSKCTKDKMSQSHSGNKNAMFGKTHSKDSKLKIANAKKIPIQIDDITYPSKKDACIALNITYYNLCKLID